MERITLSLGRPCTTCLIAPLSSPVKWVCSSSTDVKQGITNLVASNHTHLSSHSFSDSRVQAQLSWIFCQAAVKMSAPAGFSPGGSRGRVHSQAPSGCWWNSFPMAVGLVAFTFLQNHFLQSREKETERLPTRLHCSVISTSHPLCHVTLARSQSKVPPILEGKGSHQCINMAAILLPVLHKGDHSNRNGLMGFCEASTNEHT